MNEARAPTNENVKEQILAEYRTGVRPKELSEKTGISINTIKSWIKREKTKRSEVEEGAPASKKDAPFKSKKGAPPGNQNAKGAGAPDRNKNAEKQGAYSKIYWDHLMKRFSNSAGYRKVRYGNTTVNWVSLSVMNGSCSGISGIGLTVLVEWLRTSGINTKDIGIT